MEISPIPEMRDFTVVKAPTADFQLSTVVDMEAVARTDHSARAGKRRKAAGAEDEEGQEPESGSDATESAEDQPKPTINLFA